MTNQTIHNQHHADLYAPSNNFTFGFPLPTSMDQSSNKKPPTSAPTSLKNRHTENQTRPESLQHRRTITSPESQLLDKWSEDLQQYETVLDSMVSTSLDNNVKEEIKHVDQWYQYLSETERTATMYALLQHSTPLQSRFFITVLQQLGKKDPVTSLLSPVYTEFDIPSIAPTATNQSYHETSNGDIQPNYNKNRRSYAFGEMDESIFQRQPYPSFGETGGGLASSPSSSSSGGRRLSDDFLDTPASYQFSAPTSTSSNWANRSMNTGLHTGNQETLTYPRHSYNRPKSADISHWSLGVSPSQPSNNNSNSNNHQQQTSFFAPPTSDALSTTPTTPTRLSWHGGLSSLATDSVFYPPTIQQSGKKGSDQVHAGTGDSIDTLTDKLNQWSLYPYSDLPSNGNNQRHLYRRSQYSSHWNNGSDVSLPPYYHQVYPSTATQQPSSSTSSTLPHTAYSNNKRAASNLRHYDLYSNHQKNTASTKSIEPGDSFTTAAAASQFTGKQQRDRYHMEQISIKLLEDIPAWLKSLRLHKYTHLFRSMTWQNMIQLSDDDLMAKGVAALGARRKLLKVFDQVKNHCDKNDIKYKPE